MTFPPMRPQVEIQRVHDMLMDVLADEQLTDAVLPEEVVRPLMMAADALCWILHHDADSHADSHASSFAMIIKLLREELADRGMEWQSPGEYLIEE